MIELISYLIAFGIVFGIPYLISKRDEERRIDNMKREMDKRENLDEWNK